jgi:ABC-type multidrug transport system fused ATPase/permease subunit
LVLKGLSITINPSEKIGIAGRTGSGKSSLMVALFRIAPLVSGRIFIDGIDVSTVPLSILRSKIGIIPQDPVIFSATIKYNLDPFSLHTDEELWDVLEMVKMKEAIESLPLKLLDIVSESGDSLSLGQRQLINIGRVLLRKVKILVLDEATASIDNDTDNLIQTMIRDRFKECTVLTIAHRLHTIIEADRIMVLDQGELGEFDTPGNLIANPDGLFAKLWSQHQESHTTCSQESHNHF